MMMSVSLLAKHLSKERFRVLVAVVLVRGLLEETILMLVMSMVMMVMVPLAHFLELMTHVS